ncbi:MAG: hypothetical protein LBU15_00860 [Rickettsiales bacterium]|jgi:hypothetical protein|nr:hypothetical protein [Rickettsiales bacterium]
MSDQENNGIVKLAGATKHKDLESLLGAVWDYVRTKDIFNMSPKERIALANGARELMLKGTSLTQSSTMGGVRDFISEAIPAGGENIKKFGSRVLDFILSTGEKSLDKISDKGINAETKFLACLLKYTTLGALSKDANLREAVGKEIELLTKFFRTTVAPEYKKDTASKNKTLLSWGTGKKGKEHGKLLTMHMYMFLVLRTDNDIYFLDAMLDAVPEFLRSDVFNFQGGGLLHFLIGIQYNNWELAGKYIATNPEQIYSFHSTISQKEQKLGDPVKSNGKSLLSDLADGLDDDFALSFSTESRCQPNFLSDLIGRLTGSNTLDDAKKTDVVELLFRTLEALNGFIENNENNETTLKDIGYHLNCPIIYGNETPVRMETPLEALARMAGEEHSNPRETDILKKSLELLTSERIELKTLGELKLEAYSAKEAELASELKSKLKELDRGPLRKSSNFAVVLANRIFGTKFNTVAERKEVMEREINEKISRIREKKGEESSKDSEKTKKTRDLISRILKKDEAKTVERVEMVEQAGKELEHLLGEEKKAKENGGQQTPPH